MPLSSTLPATSTDLTKLALALLLFLVAAPAAHSQGGLAALDGKNGFRDLKFGVAKKDIKGLEQACLNVDNLSICRRATDAKEIGEAKLDNIFYLFYRDSLAAVLIGFNGTKSRNEIVQTFIQAYGPCRQSSYSYDVATKRKVHKYAPVKYSSDFDANEYARWKGRTVRIDYLPNRDFDLSNCKEIKLPPNSENSMMMLTSWLLEARVARDKSKMAQDKVAKALKDL